MNNNENKKYAKAFWIIMFIVFIAVCIGVIAVLRHTAENRNYDLENGLIITNAVTYLINI